LISNYHVVKDAAKVRLLTGAGMVDAKVVQVDAADDLALLKADGRFAPLPILPSKAIPLGGTVATIGFPDPGLQGFAPKVLAHGHQCVGGAGGERGVAGVLADGHQVNYAPSPRPSPIGWERVSVRTGEGAFWNRRRVWRPG
jgi:Trypsin-like peptidase domain